MTNQHPITPPPELVDQWADMLACRSDQAVFTFAAQWGADQELEACCEWVSAVDGKYGPRLRLARRPKPPSLKKQALTALGLIETDNVNTVSTFCKSIDTVRRALEALPDD